jgi:hypothetical protein
MSFRHGRNAEAWVEGLDLSPFLHSMQSEVTADTAESSTFKRRSKTFLKGQHGAMLTFDGYYDPGQIALEARLDVDAGAILTAGSGGMAAVGDRARLVEVLDTALGDSTPIGGLSAISWGVLATGPVGRGRVLHPLAEVDADGDGATYDGLASSDAGAIAHLHVTAVSTGDEIDVIVEDSANGADWDPVAGGAFETADAPGAQRLFIAGEIRRYLRVSWDLVGPGDQEVTFGVALARR